MTWKAETKFAVKKLWIEKLQVLSKVLIDSLRLNVSTRDDLFQVGTQITVLIIILLIVVPLPNTNNGKTCINNIKLCIIPWDQNEQW